MKRIVFLSGLWFAVFAVGLGGLFSGSPLFMGGCLLAWTPLAVMWGFSLARAGVRITFDQAPAVARRPTTKPERRVRRVES
jgi:hypothetical protein